MESKQSQNQQTNEELGGNGKAGGGGFLCRQSSTRWTPTTDQIRILKDLYYNNGVRSPSADQIQRISARLRQYGKIEGKNVFYWFQNHKARERQKKRFTNDQQLPIQKSNPPSSVASAAAAAAAAVAAAAAWKPTHDHHESSAFHNKYPNHNIASGVCPSAPSSSVMVAVGHLGNYGSYGSATVENSFRDCSISSGGSSSMMGSRANQNMGMGWIGVDPYSSPSMAANFFENRKSVDESMEDDEQGTYEIETLPLFPIHGDRNHLVDGFCNNMKPGYSDGAGYYTAWYGVPNEVSAGSRTSLELSLNSYTTISPDDA